MDGGGMANELYLSHSDEFCEDARVQRAIWEEIAWEPQLDASGVRVDVHDRMAVLSGVVGSYPEKLAVERAADRVPGLQNVTNQVTVEPAERRSDEALLAVVTAALAANVLVPPGAISVQVTAGAVALAGRVAAEAQREAAVRTVSELRGVRDVHDRVTVGWGSGAIDLAGRVHRALTRDSMLHDRVIQVEVHGGEAVLHGTVRSLAERAEAEEVARRVPGVIRVADDLHVRP
jgi:osmotically-inducible protein OsmY